MREAHMQLDPDLIPDLVNGSCLNDYMGTINPLYHLGRISKFGILKITYQGSIQLIIFTARNLSTLRNDLERCPCSRGDPGCSLLSHGRDQQALGCPLFVEEDGWPTQAIFGVASCSTSPWLLNKNDGPLLSDLLFVLRSAEKRFREVFWSGWHGSMNKLK